MQFVASKDTREGMCVAEDICDPQGRVLIARGQRLGMHHIIRMRKFRIRSIFIDPANGETVVKPTRSDLREQCQQVLGEACGRMRQEFANKKVVLDAVAIKTATDSLLQALSRSNKPLVTLCNVGASSDRLLQHSVNVAVLGLVLALDLRAPRDMMHDLAVALLFHDTGMIFLPNTLLYSATPPTQEQCVEIERHSQLGFEHLVHSQAVSQTACGLILRHHERLDGSGYPGRLRGDKLSLLSCILAVAEAYDSLTGPRFGIAPVLPDAAISYIISNADTLFERQVAVALCKRVALYPVGAAVQLTTGEYGIVAGLLPDQPHRPIVLAHLDRRRVAFKQPLVVDLTGDRDRAILRSAATLPELLQAKSPEFVPPAVDARYANIG